MCIAPVVSSSPPKPYTHAESLNLMPETTPEAFLMRPFDNLCGHSVFWFSTLQFQVFRIFNLNTISFSCSSRINSLALVIVPVVIDAVIIVAIVVVTPHSLR